MTIRDCQEVCVRMNDSLNLFLKILEKGVPFSYDWFEQKNTYRKKKVFMNNFTKNMAQALFNQDKINDLLRKELQQAVKINSYIF